MEEPKKSAGRKRLWPLLLIFLVLAIGGIYFLQQDHQPVPGGKTPTLTIETPRKIDKIDEEFSLDVTISGLGSTVYPAASMTIDFDSSRLEFLGIAEGNVFVYDRDNSASGGKKLPEWSCNPQRCNEQGQINVIYLDLTGGKHAFSKDLLSKEENIVLRLQFRLRGSVRSGDVIDLTAVDAVFAASDETKSLAMTTNTLKVKNSKVVVGDLS